MEEIWLDVKDYIGLYQVSNWGRVKSLERDEVYYANGKQVVRHRKERILRPKPDGGGYLQVILCKNGVQKPKGVHVLMAQAFLPNPNNYEHVHHRNHINTDNRIENLEWLSKEEHYALHQSDRAEAVREACSKVVYQYTLDGFLVNVWESTREAERQLEFKHTNISRCCLGKDKTHKGYRWSYTPL